jgi:hypothetical protein
VTVTVTFQRINRSADNQDDLPIGNGDFPVFSESYESFPSDLISELLKKGQFAGSSIFQQGNYDGFWSMLLKTIDL